MRYAQHLSTRQTPQSQPIPGSTQVQNSAGGYAWQVDCWALLDRFLILGTEGGSYYATEKELTLTAGHGLLDCISADGLRTVARIVEVSESGRAPKNDPAIFALAACSGAGDEATRVAALEALPRVCRIGTHLFQFTRDVEAFRGWGPALRKAVGRWYTEKTPGDLAYQCVKYRNRGGTTHRDVLRLSHPKAMDGEQNALLCWIAGKTPEGDLPRIVTAFEQAQTCADSADAIAILRDCPALPWEAFPSEILAKPAVWEAMIPTLPLTALMRNLARMTANTALRPMTGRSAEVVARLTDAEALRKARVHPIQALTTMLTYAAGRGLRGSLTWTPIPQIVDALDEAFYLSFGNVEPTGKRLLLAVDTSGSMMSGNVAGVIGLTPRKAATAMAMVAARTEAQWQAVGFSDHVAPVALSARQRLNDAMRVFDGPPHSTDCALPMLWALENNIEADCFVIYTDSETWFGAIHPAQALRQYREKTGIPAKLVVCAMVANNLSIADPEDAGMMDVVGFDTATPQIISDFARH